jgi:hypothetical protein
MSSASFMPPPPPYSMASSASFSSMSATVQAAGGDFRSFNGGGVSNKKRQLNLRPPAAASVSANANSNGAGIPEELCLVCGDKASGYHYNALTCEGLVVQGPY